MSVSSTSVKVQYTGDGVTTIFSFPFNVLSDVNAGVAISPTDVAVYFGAPGAEVLQSTANYTVNGPYAVVNPNTVVFNSAPPSGTPILIIRAKPLTQPSRFLDGQPFAASSFEMALDRLTMEVQQLQEQLSRVPTLPPATALVNPQLANLQAGMYLIVDSLGQNITLTGATNSPVSQDVGAAPPVSGNYTRGWIRWNNAPTAGGVIGWVCTAAGNPGTWKAFGQISL